MGAAENIKTSIVRVEDKMRARPSIGHLTKSSKASIADGLVVGDDISQEMVNRAEARRRKNDVLNLRFARRDAEQPVSDDEVPFDVALCALGLMYVPDPVAALDAMRRALCSGSLAGEHYLAACRPVAAHLAQFRLVKKLPRHGKQHAFFFLKMLMGQVEELTDQRF